MIVYEIIFKKNPDTEELIYSPFTTAPEIAVASAKLTKKINEASSLTFTIHKTHPLYNNIVPMAGVIVVYETVNNGFRKVIFQGKVVTAEYNFRMDKKVTCTGGLGWLKFSQFSRYLNRFPITPNRPKLFPTSKFAKNESVQNVVERVLRQHNWQMKENSSLNNGELVDEDDHYVGMFKLGKCTARQNPYGVNVKDRDETEADGTYITRDQTSLINTYDWFQNEIVGKCEPNIVVDEGTGEIDIFDENQPIDRSQEIVIGRNLIGYSKSQDYSKMCTVFFPVGKTNQQMGMTYTTDDIINDVIDAVINPEDVKENKEITPNEPVIVYTSIADSGKSNEIADRNPVIYVTNYDTDHSEGQATIDTTKVDNPDYIAELVNEGKVITIANGKEAVIATDEQYPGGITFRLESPFIVWVEGVKRYGRIVGTKQWASATRERLRAYGPSHFKRLIYSLEETEVNAIDLALIEENRDKSIEVGKRYHVWSDLNGVDEHLPCTSIEIDLLSARGTIYTFKKVRKPFTKIVKDMATKINAIEDCTVPKATRVGFKVPDPSGKDRIMELQ